MNPPGGHIDLQVNGYGGVDFNQDNLSSEDLRLACEAMRRDNVASLLTTIITDDVDVMCRRLHRLVQLREEDELASSMIAGVHIEGPFVNEAEGYRGAHPKDAIVPACVETMERLLDAAGGFTRVVTLAPERDPDMKVTRLLARRGITVSAGHCNPTLDQLDAAIDAGLSMFTHLGNACPMQMDRHDNIVQRVLARSKQLWVCFIADGVHIPFYALRNYLRIAGVDRCIVVSDAMAAAGLGPGRHTMGRWDVEVGEDLAVWAPCKTHLLGSAMSMAQAALNLKRELGLSDQNIAALTHGNPSRALQISTGDIINKSACPTVYRLGDPSHIRNA